ncbi:peptidylprolyl isomerase [Helicobacter cetorum]|uniref:Peptidyl-prolyl cis-trans isomerase n=1 Tax=Helicobacter cetorum (strain ATCC BAA-540 / CCUG 52418 / MIT 99-5656) TaxID=1163745 RepID=I0EQG7_HELCM|nr:peptidylprolyl isomerase [Helicobacter cetorum]AFI05186.1 peptidyl-prolyl cis-trans isomerase B, cyclosporin-type rotamase (ppi) [Helicobacter cetorum MIT 99-5656]
MDSIKTYDIKEEELAKCAYATLKTNQGSLTLELFYKDAPQAVSNFITLAKEGFYNGLSFHRVIAGFVAQGGCPYGTGTGGPGHRIKCEVANNPHKHKRGSLSMAHAGRDTGGSQFFLCFVDLPHLDGEHTVFGKIINTEGLAVLDKIKQGDIIEGVTFDSSL